MATILEPQVQDRRCGSVEVRVIDGLFDPALVQMIDAILRRVAFECKEFDTPESKGNLHWSSDFDIEAISSHPVLGPFFRKVTQITRAEYPGRELTLLRAYCNSNGYGDHTVVHIDDRQGVTALYYANADWNDDCVGETLFYDDRKEPVLALAPRPGRLAIFSGAIPHRAGIPSRTCFEKRRSVAFKFRLALLGLFSLLCDWKDLMETGMGPLLA